MSVHIKFKVNLPATAPHGATINEDMRGVDGQIITCMQYYSTYYDWADVKTGWVYRKDWLLPVEDERPTYPNPPHRHAELIKAWADGAEVEFLSTHGRWIAVGDVQPHWRLTREYRIKPTIDSTKKKELQDSLKELMDKAREIERKIGEL